MRKDRFSYREERTGTTLFPRVKAIVRIGTFCIIGASVIGIIFFSRIFTIEYVDIEASPGIHPTAIREIVFSQEDQKRLLILPQKNLFVFSRSQLIREISRRFVIDSIEVKKEFPHTLRITLSGQPFRLILVYDKKIFDMASDGSVASELSEEPTNGKPVLVVAHALASDGDARGAVKSTDVIDAPIVRLDESVGGSDVDQLTLDADTISFIRAAFSFAREQRYQPLYFTVTRENPTIKMKTREGWDVLLTSLESPEKQMKHLRSVIDTTIKQDRKKLDYVDVRFDNRVFYKEQ